jgi:hypothetical protein
VQQVALVGVDLDDAEPCREGATTGGLERGDDAVDAGFVQRDGHGIAFIEGDGAGADDRPAALLRGQGRPTPPRDVAARLPPGVGQLDARDGALAMDEGGAGYRHLGGEGRGHG